MEWTRGHLRTLHGRHWFCRAKPQCIWFCSYFEQISSHSRFSSIQVEISTTNKGTNLITCSSSSFFPEEYSIQLQSPASKSSQREVSQVSWKEDGDQAPSNGGETGKTQNNRWRRAFLTEETDVGAVKPGSWDREQQVKKTSEDEQEKVGRQLWPRPEGGERARATML